MYDHSSLLIILLHYIKISATTFHVKHLKLIYLNYKINYKVNFQTSKSRLSSYELCNYAVQFKFSSFRIRVCFADVVS